VLATGPGEAIVALPASTPDLRVAIASLGGTGQPTLELAGTRLRLRAAVGTATLEAGSDAVPARVLSRARAALARARGGPAPRVLAHADGDPESLLDGLAVAAMLQEALERGAFRLVFLPKVRVIDRAVIGAEALIRWTLPSTGEAVPARRILDAAADAGLLDEVGAWALREACRRAASWCAAGAELPVSVNIAPSQFRRGDLVDQVHMALGEAGLPGRLLTLEAPEGVLSSGTGDAVAQLEAVRAAGASVAIDDFGTGIDGIACLHRCPADEVKLDRSVVARLPGSAEDRATLDLVQRHARRLGARCVAEGIERADQWALLSERGWDAAQGWLVSRPIDGADVPGFARGGAERAPAHA
jgi:EAL domain-containing protein (putative c-di-GMP-specific phosphodiesterase class I)